ncbi:MAG: HAD family hydrolase [Candidatus Desulfaltia sp.]|nr:HAD family hydrolase [Candidatus Desulfaltia sp.]
MNWEAVFFDFDGVILDSVDVKTRAFAKMFREYGPEVEKKVVEYHLNNGGVSRFDKFRYFYEKILNKPVDEEIIKGLSKQFSNLVVDEILASPFMPGAKESLENLKEKEIPCYIVSATPYEEINLIVEKKDLKEYFKEVHGSPRKKWEICQEIINRKNYNPQNCLFLGDAMSDYEAAQKNGICFLGIVRGNEVPPFPDGTPVSFVVTLEFPSLFQ